MPFAEGMKVQGKEYLEVRKRFHALAVLRGIDLKDAFYEAMLLWLEKHREKERNDA